MTRIHKNVSFDATASVGEKWMCSFPKRTTTRLITRKRGATKRPLVRSSLSHTNHVPRLPRNHKLWELVFVPKRGVFLVFYQYS